MNFWPLLVKVRGDGIRPTKKRFKKTVTVSVWKKLFDEIRPFIFFSLKLFPNPKTLYQTVKSYIFHTWSSALFPILKPWNSKTRSSLTSAQLRAKKVSYLNHHFHTSLNFALLKFVNYSYSHHLCFLQSIFVLQRHTCRHRDHESLFHHYANSIYIQILIIKLNHFLS